MTEEQKKYIENNIELIEHNDWNKFFEVAPYGVGGILISAGVNFLTEVDCVPYSAFDHCDDILTITIPDNIDEIQPWAFNRCKNLKTVVFSNNLKIIDAHSFSSCKSLTDIKFPDGLTEINSYAFNSCDSLSKVHIPSSVVKIDSKAFARCGHIDIVYDGTKENWSKIIKSHSFDSTSYTCICSDGKVYN